MVQRLLLGFEGGGQTFEFAFAFGKFLLVLGERLLFGRGLRALFLLQRRAFVFEACALPFDGVAFGGDLLVGELVLEHLLAFQGFAVLAFELRELLVSVRIGFVAAGDDHHGTGGNCGNGWDFHGRGGLPHGLTGTRCILFRRSAIPRQTRPGQGPPPYLLVILIEAGASPSLVALSVKGPAWPRLARSTTSASPLKALRWLA